MESNLNKKSSEFQIRNEKNQNHTNQRNINKTKTVFIRNVDKKSKANYAN